ncbi:hypothetical protein GQ55_1G367800 [Panicum hallii var. hallii]|uniref:UBC core domain-containing protein n=1 Tax=Panicum hallii var. hallii TaxID=1504633 RepID=A0A2T7FBE5_9POAL|nr:hypothetical protein GQ55_1G367800 [Panicum hallii var. hallii]
MGSEPYRERIRRELRQIWVDPPAFCRPGASPVTYLLHWEVVIDGPDGSPYAGGTFPVDVDFGRTTYPLRPPKITFRTKVYHPNINSEGEMTLDIFCYENWSAAMTVRKLLRSSSSSPSSATLAMLDDHPTNDEASDVYESDLELYEQMAMAWTWEYSSTPIVSYYPPVEKDERRWLDWWEADEAAEEWLRRYEAEKRRRRQEEEMLAASSPARDRRIALPRVTWNRAVAFLQGWAVALPFPTFRRRMYSAVLPLSNHTGRACSNLSWTFYGPS